MELIVTQWDVNKEQKVHELKLAAELIVTWWDVNWTDEKGKKHEGNELIVTQWDVNEKGGHKGQPPCLRINSYIVGCKFERAYAG